MKTNLALGCCALLFIALSFGLRGQGAAAHAQVTTDDDIYYLPPNAWLKVFAAGYNEGLADLIWIKSIVYFSEAPKAHFGRSEKAGRAAQAHDEGAEVNYFLRYIRAVHYLDPWFAAVFSHGGRLALYHEGRISVRSLRASMEILEAGLEKYPNDGELLFALGFLHYYEFQPFAKNDAEKEAMKAQGAELIRRATLATNAPEFATRLALTLSSRHGMTDLVVAHLEAQLAAETNPDIRELLRHELGQAASAAALADAARVDELWQGWKAQMPWAPFDLYALVLGSQSAWERQLDAAEALDADFDAVSDFPGAP
ncbi:MAG: hypothetical protein M0R76_10130 [Proteobacteria bacterium]|nr:hypothetical protein [Pseudomonadota bacterium]